MPTQGGLAADLGRRSPPPIDSHTRTAVLTGESLRAGRLAVYNPQAHWSHAPHVARIGTPAPITGVSGNVSPQSLNVKGGTQPEIYQGTVGAMAQELRADAAKFWQEALARDGPIEVWEINGERWLYNGNHRYQAAIKAGVAIPASNVKVVTKPGGTVPTWRFNQMTWLPGLK